jgi:concanavalin A-like lectin/glucanase superfamily protein
MKIMVAKLSLVFTISVILVLIFSNPGETAIDPESISGIWLFDEGSGDFAADLSENGNEGEIKGDPDWIDGKFGGALQFNGETDWVQMADSPSLRVFDEVSVMAWVRLDRHTFPGVNWQGLVAKGNNPRSYTIYTDNTKQALVSIHSGGVHVVGLSQALLPLDEWFHLAYVITPGVMKCFVNGAVAKETANAALKDLPGDGDTNDFLVGRTWEDQRFLGGAMDEVALFTVALSDDEIKRIADNGLERGIGLAAVDPAGKLATTWSKIRVKY